MIKKSWETSKIFLKYLNEFEPLAMIKIELHLRNANYYPQTIDDDCR